MFRAGYEIGPYRLVRKLGRGSFGEVWLAQRHTKITAINVALKIPITDVDINVIKQEADLWVQASGHSNVLPIIEAEIYDDQVVIVSEYAPDGSLQEWLNLHNGSAPSVESAVQMTLGILNGLEHLHGKKIIHRDLKPANILLQGNTPRLADFGLSRVVKSGSVSSIVAGTPEYMAPEAFKGKRNERTDLWSVGVILHQLVSGGLPFRSSDPLSMMAIIQDEEPAPLGEDVPSAIRTIVACSLSKDPMKRATCAAQMRGQLLEAMGQVKDAAGAAAERPPRDERDHPGKIEPLPRVGYADAKGASQLRVWAGGAGVAPQDAETIPMGVSPATPKAASKWRWRWIVYAAAMALALGITILMVATKERTRQPEFLTYQFQAVRIDGSGNVVERSPGQAFYFADDLDDGVILEMVEIPGGSFQMGSPEGEAGKNPNEYPRHKVTVPGFCMSKFEITQSQWRAVVGTDGDLNPDPSQFKGNNLPVEQVSWDDAMAFCALLSRKTGLTYTLPSEAEWEYACRAGRPSPFAFGETVTPELVNYDWSQPYGKVPPRNSLGKTTAAGSFGVPNGFGLYDMLGNVYEWCQDSWHENYNYNPPVDGSAWKEGGDQSRVVRGGSWNKSGFYCRSASRYWFSPELRQGVVGFRVVTSLPRNP